MTWAEINNKRLPFIRMGERLFRGMYGKIRTAYLKSLDNLTTPEEIIQAALAFRFDESLVMKDYERYYLKTSIAFAKNVKKASHKKIETKQEDDWTRIILEYVRTKAGNKITKTVSTAYADIERITRAAVKQGISEGWGMDQIARQIRSQQGEIDLWKALRIARTEVVSASNEGVKLGAEDIPGNKTKVWISTFDERSRPEHMEMDGVKVGFTDMFDVDGEKLEYPGDPSGSPGNIINCRCGYEVLIEPEY